MQMRSIFRFILIITLFFLGIAKAIACTEVQLNYSNKFVVGRNFDWPAKVKYTFLVVNPKGITHHSDDMNVNQKALQWTAKYGSITLDLGEDSKKFNPEAVLGGINQYGLSASALWLAKSMYPNAPEKPALATGLWVQYFLDNAKTVNEAIKLASTITVEPAEPAMLHYKKVLLHLVIHDATGDAAVMDYTGGKLKIYHEKTLPILALTNDTYPESLQNLKQYQNFGGDLPLPGSYGSKARFVRAATFLKQLPPITSNQEAVAYTFQALGDTAEAPGTSSPTIWSVVFDLPNKILYYRDMDNQNIRFVELQHFNFAEGQPTKTLLLNNNLSGNVNNNFVDARLN